MVACKLQAFISISCSDSENDAICNRAITATGYSTGLLSRRYLCSRNDGRGDQKSHPKSFISLGKVGFSDQFSEKCFNIYATTGVPRLRLQYRDYADHGPGEENIKVNAPHQTGTESSTTSAQLSLVRQFDGKDDAYDTSHWRGLITYSPHAERFSDDTQPISSKLECTDIAIYRKQERTTLVVTMDDEEERPSHKEDNNRSREDPDDLCRCLGLGMGSEFHHNPNNRSLDNRREYSIHQCERTYSDLLCPKTPCQKVSQLPHQIVHRQYHSSQIQQQVEGHSIQDITRRFAFSTVVASSCRA
ncbi:hypothetical protein G6F62_003498 [Rhizopus arrhizus]|nr:hypothetical protein G6F62_003498 [Rhizopus arrhizus]